MIYQVWADSFIVAEFLDLQSATIYAERIICLTVDACIAITNFLY